MGVGVGVGVVVAACLDQVSEKGYDNEEDGGEKRETSTGHRAPARARWRR